MSQPIEGIRHVLAIQPRHNPSGEQGRLGEAAALANAKLDAQSTRGPRVAIRHVNPFKDNPEIWTRQSFLTEQPALVFVAGSADIDHADLTPDQARYNAFVMPVLRELMEDPTIPVLGECHGDQAMGIALGGEVVRDEARQEGGTHILTATDLGMEHVLFEGFGQKEPMIFGHKDSVGLDALVEGRDYVILGTTELDGLSVWATPDGKKMALQGHPSLEEGHLAQKAFDSPAPGLKPYKRTANFEDTPGSRGMLANVMAAAAQGRSEWFGK